MPIKKSILSAIIIGASLNSATFANENLWYVGISANQVDIDRIETQRTQSVAGVTRNIDIESDDETGYGFTIGRNVLTQANGNTLGIELNYSNSDNDLEELGFMSNVFLSSDNRASGSTEIDTLLIRAKYQFDLGLIKPYVGVGIGESDVEVAALYGMSIGSSLGTQPPFASGNDSATAIELRLGAEYQLSDQFGIFAEYTSTDVDDIEFDRRGGGPGGLATTIQSGDVEFDSFNIGLNFRF